MGCTSNDNSGKNAKASCAMCNALSSSENMQSEAKLLNGFKLVRASAIVFLLPLFSSIGFALTQDTAIKKFFFLLIGFCMGIVISFLLSKLLIKNKKALHG